MFFSPTTAFCDNNRILTDGKWDFSQPKIVIFHPRAGFSQPTTRSNNQK
jgi:hypothetical protein